MRPDHLHDLDQKDFDQIYDETAASHPGATPEEIEVLVNAKMQIRQSHIRERLQRDNDRAEALKIPLDDELYHGWRAFQLQEGYTQGLERSDFEENMAYLLQRHPHKLLYFRAFWLQALTDPAAAHERLDREITQTMHEVEHMLHEAFEGEMGRQMTRFIETMTKPK